MTSYQLPPIEVVPTLSATERAEILDTLFEPCVPLHTLSLGLLHELPFKSYNDMIASIGMQMTDLSKSSSTSDTAWLLEILSTHPRLGEQKVESAQSRAEQAQLQSEGSHEVERLRELNTQYEEAFGFRYVSVVLRRKVEDRTVDCYTHR